MSEHGLHSGLKLYLDQLAAVIAAKLSIPALMMSLPLPEALGRLEFRRKNSDVFTSWWDRYMPPMYQTRLPGAKARKLRNDLIHNFGGTDETDKTSDLAFSFPELSMVEFHGVELDVGGRNVHVLSALRVASDIQAAAMSWMEAPPIGFDILRMNRMLKINFNLLEPIGSGIPLMTMRNVPEGQCNSLSIRQ
ncbi:hypothetical protein [Mesorhizobium sp.]|jgi:hypothetical protein|uniref:hypothetical protein n=1 Tax=Mesorhizobium sp. TaxID=1871066 RepID=UPI0035680AB1